MRQRSISRSILAAAVLALGAGSLFGATNADREKAIKLALVDKLGEDSGNIQVAFFDGKAVLSGQVAEDWTQELAKEVALYVPGVTEVENQVEAVKERQVGGGKIAAEAQDASLESSIKDALHNEIGKYSGDIEVEVCDGFVSLRGRLPDIARQDLAVATAAKVKGVQKVIDLLRSSG